jgi:hypothetical protein
MGAATASISLQFSQMSIPERPSQAVSKKVGRSLQRPWGAPLPIPTGQAPQQGRNLFRQPSLCEAQPSIVGDALTSAPIPSFPPVVLSSQCWEGFDEDFEGMPEDDGPNEGFFPMCEETPSIVPWRMAATLGGPCDGVTGRVSGKATHVNIRQFDLGEGLETLDGRGGGPMTPVLKPSRPPTPVRLAVVARSPADGADGPYSDTHNFTGGRRGPRRASAPDSAARPPSPNGFPPPSPALTRATSIMTSLYLRGSLGRQSPISTYDPLGPSPMDARGRGRASGVPRRTTSQRRGSIPAFRNMERRFTVPAQNDALSWCLDSLPTPPAPAARRSVVDPAGPAGALSRPPSARNGAKAPAPFGPPGPTGQPGSAMSRLTPTLDDAWAYSPPCTPDGAPGAPFGSSDARMAPGSGATGAGEVPPLSPRRARWRELGALPMPTEDQDGGYSPSAHSAVPASDAVRNPADISAAFARKESRAARRPQVQSARFPCPVAAIVNGILDDNSP